MENMNDAFGILLCGEIPRQSRDSADPDEADGIVTKAYADDRRAALVAKILLHACPWPVRYELLRGLTTKVDSEKKPWKKVIAMATELLEETLGCTIATLKCPKHHKHGAISAASPKATFITEYVLVNKLIHPTWNFTLHSSCAQQACGFIYLLICLWTIDHSRVSLGTLVDTAVQLGLDPRWDREDLFDSVAIRRVSGSLENVQRALVRLETLGDHLRVSRAIGWIDVVSHDTDQQKNNPDNTNENEENTFIVPMPRTEADVDLTEFHNQFINCFSFLEWKGSQVQV